MPVQRGFGKDRRAVHGDFKPPVARRDQYEPGNHRFKMHQQLIRHPDGTRPVVSDLAIFDLDLHILLLALPRKTATRRGSIRLVCVFSKGCAQVRAGGKGKRPVCRP
jgi:hypothetical protein